MSGNFNMLFPIRNFSVYCFLNSSLALCTSTPTSWMQEVLLQFCSPRPAPFSLSLQDSFWKLELGTQYNYEVLIWCLFPVRAVNYNPPGSCCSALPRCHCWGSLRSCVVNVLVWACFFQGILRYLNVEIRLFNTNGVCPVY